MALLPGTPLLPYNAALIVTLLLIVGIIFIFKCPKDRKNVFGFRLGSWPYHYTIILPLALAPIADIILGGRYGGEHWLLSLFSAPIIEEILWRAVFIGVLGFILLKYTTKGKYETPIYLGLIIASSISFAAAHPAAVFSREFLIILINGLIYGILYWKNRFNLLPAILCHAAGNLFLLILF